MSGVTATLTKEALDLFMLAKEEGWFDKLKYLLKKRNRVLILGSTGVGKTNLLHALKKPLPEAIDNINRSQFAQKHKLVIAAEPFEFIDTPGQAYHNVRRSAAIREQMAKGSFGILNVVAFGYHEYAMARGEVFDGDGKVRPEYLERHREVEMTALADWVELLGDPETAKYLITVVTKADLWWDEQATALAHYTVGIYNKALGPARSLDPATVEFAAVRHRFYGQGSLAGSFDDSVREQLRSRLFSTLLEAIGR